jgi:hypothetical protein
MEFGMNSIAAASSHRLPLSDGQWESLLRLCNACPQPMVIADCRDGDIYRNEAANLSDVSSLKNAFDLVDHRGRVLARLHVDLP